MVEENTYQIGYNAESLVKSELEKIGIEADFVDKWYDFDIEVGNVKRKLEVKCTNLVIENGHQCVRYGRFDFTNPKNVKKQRTNNVYYCFVVAIKGEYQILGFAHAKTINAKRYISLNYLMNNHKLKNTKTFAQMLHKKNGQN